MAPLIPTGRPTPDFTLPDLNGREHRLQDYRGRIVILNFWSAECPWSARADESLLARVEDWGDRVALLPIASNFNEPLALLRRVSRERGLPLVLHDAEGRVASLYGAQTTPHLFVMDPQGVLRYQGALDDVTFRKREPEVPFLIQAVEAVLAGREPDPLETQPYGCTLVLPPP